MTRIPTEHATSLKAKGLGKRYGGASGEVVALKDFSHTFMAGTLSVIMGPSGSGKSTLLNLLAGLDTPTEGSVTVGDQDLTTLAETARADLRLNTFGFVFQSFNLITVLSALQNVAFPMGLASVSKTEREAKAKTLLGRFGLGERLNHLPHKLSGGERQRVSLARALANDPAVIFADEPTGNLDSKSGRIVLDALRGVADEGRTVIVVTHDPAVTEIADTLIRLKDGQKDSS